MNVPLVSAFLDNLEYKRPPSSVILKMVFIFGFLDLSTANLAKSSSFKIKDYNFNNIF
jgi:hypothetical protein